MAIPESQLVTWSHQGSIIQSSSTYATIKNALEATGSSYTDKNYKIFLQGSYCNDTNIYSESDVDVVIRLDSTFYKDLESLPEDQKNLFNASHTDASYSWRQFKDAVFVQLTAKFGSSAKLGAKAIKIDASGSRRSADVIVAAQYRRYYKFLSHNNQSYDEGICFLNSASTLIANYPYQHSQNCTKKHQATGSWFKPMVRIMKNMRSKLVNDGIIDSGLASSYYIEGLLYNVPNEMYGGSYDNSFVNSINWIYKEDRSKFVTANEQYYLLRENSPVCWDPSKSDAFLNALKDLWNKW
ncbi:MAG: nucleotidyltransferase [Ignavibacteriaceae bacterium]|nr:nucleotidyltransferase [Ignavibacteriaceae bacterium]